MDVLINIKKEYLRNYLGFLFAFEDGAYSVFRHTDFGKLLVSLVKYSDKPVDHIKTEQTVRIILPKTRATRTAEKHYLYYTREDQAKLNDFLEAIFNIDFDQFFLAGVKLGVEQKEIVNDFIVNRRLTSMIGNIETIKKRSYRTTLDLQKKALDKLYKRAHYRNISITNYLRAI
ncbi:MULTISPECIES: hypothetical protein [Olivibacter]|uniref:Homing endonuclease LAGLIDADG domain-containing protein n=1 Tax=Olivibacter jilunii TaxID=985016 RepID=A0ABW6B031_9SPHI